MMSVQTSRLSIPTPQSGNERAGTRGAESDGDPRFGALMRRADPDSGHAARPKEEAAAAPEKAAAPAATQPADGTAPQEGSAQPLVTEPPMPDAAAKALALKSARAALGQPVPAPERAAGDTPEPAPDAKAEDATTKETAAEPAKAALAAPTPLTDAIALLRMVSGQAPAASPDMPAALDSGRAKGVAAGASPLSNSAPTSAVTAAETAAITAFVSAHIAASKDASGKDGAPAHVGETAELLAQALADPATPTQGSAAPMVGVTPLTGGLTAAPDLSASLGQQVIDMGSGGQWIDSLAHEIASLSTGAGHGSFRLSPEHLGPMRVDIRPGAQGSDVTLTVETHAAEAMLSQDRGRLQADAQLAAVRIGEVKVERVAHIQEPARADTATGQGFGGNPSQSQGNAQAALAQGNANPNAQSQGNGQQGRKLSPDIAVSTVVEPQDRRGVDAPGDVRRARFA